MKLKTLKDLICWRDKEDHSETWVRANLLKAEAIKWVKNCDNTENFATHNMCGFYWGGTV